jgi:hypothetical protein
MNDLNKQDLDNYITGHYGNDNIPDNLGPCSTHGAMNCLQCYNLDPEDIDDEGNLVVVDGQSITDTISEGLRHQVLGRALKLTHPIPLRSQAILTANALRNMARLHPELGLHDHAVDLERAAHREIIKETT